MISWPLGQSKLSQVEFCNAADGQNSFVKWKRTTNSKQCIAMLLIYQIKVGLCLIVFCLLWKLMLIRETFHRFNRVALLTVMALALVLRGSKSR